MTKWIILCDVAWTLYDAACKSGKWRKYLAHRRTCIECRKEERNV